MATAVQGTVQQKPVGSSKPGIIGSKGIPTKPTSSGQQQIQPASVHPPASSQQSRGPTGGPPQTGAGGVGTKNVHASSSLYVGDLAKEVTEATLFELFNAVGPVASIRVCRDATTRQSLGYAYVNFHSQKDAERALDTMNFANIRGKQCRIMWSQRDPGLRHSNKGNIFVKNLHESIDNKTLYDTFSVFGSILSCKVATNMNGSSRMYGYVHYADEASAKKAIEGVNGMSINDQVVAAEPFRAREERVKTVQFTNVYVKYIPIHVSEDQLVQLFIDKVTEKLNSQASITFKHWMAKPFGVSACLNFSHYDQARTAVEILNGYDVRQDYPEEIINVVTGIENPTDEKQEQEKDKSDAENENENENEEKATEEKNTDGSIVNGDKNDGDQTDDKENDQQQTAAIVGVVAGNKDKAALLNKSQPKGLYVTRAQKRKERKFLISRQSRGRGNYGGRGGYRGQRSLFSGSNLYVKHLHIDVDDEKLKEMFAPYGEIVSAKVMKDDRQNSRGFGFVAFKTKDSATRALHDMTNTIQNNGKPLYVSRAQSKAYRTKMIMKQVQRERRTRNQQIYQGPYSNRGGGGGYNQAPFGNQYGSRANAGGVYGMPGPMQPGNMQGGLGGGMRGMPTMQQGPLAQQRLPLAYNTMGMTNPNILPNMQPGLLTNMQRPMLGVGPFGPQGANIASGIPNILGLPGNLNALQRAAVGQGGVNPLTGGVNPLTSINPNVNVGGVGGVPYNPQQIQGQSSQTNQVGRSGQQVIPPSSVGTANQNPLVSNILGTSAVNTNPTSSAQMYTPVPRTNPVTGQTFSVQSVGANASQLASTGNQPQQSASVISTGNQPSAPMKESQPLTAQMLSKIQTPAEKKRLIGERLFPKIQVVEPRLAGKITGMLLEMDNKTLLTLLQDNRQLHNKINEALAVLQEHHQKSQANASLANRASSSNVQN